MAVRRFDNTDDEIQVGPGAAVLTGAYSIAIVFDLEGGDAGWHTFVGFFNSSGLYRLGVVRDTTNKIRIDGHQGTPSFQQSPTSFVAADGWTLLVITKATGAAAPRFHFRKEGGSWVHENAAGTLGNMLTSSGGTVRFGAFSGGDPMNSLFARAAVLDGTALSDLECEALDGGTKADWLAAESWTHLWQFDQADVATDVLDEVASADETAITGTAVVAGSDPATVIDMGAGGVAPSNTVAPVASGTGVVGQQLSTTDGTWTGDATITFTYQWQRDAVNIGGATASTYTLQAADGGTNVRCVVTGTNSAGSSSANSNAIAVEAAPVNTVAPALSGTTETGQTLTCSNGTWSNNPDSFTYQWKRAGVSISGATASTYLLDVADEGELIRCDVTATNEAGSTTAQSNAVTPTAPGGLDATAFVKWGGVLVESVVRTKFGGVLYPPL